MKYLLRVTAFVIPLFVLGCTPELGSRLELGTIPQVASRSDHDFELVKVHITKFQDSRAADTIADVTGKQMRAGNDVGAVVQEAFEDAIRGRGGKLCVFDCPSISGEILKWRVDAHQEFPMSKFEAEASIRVTVLNAKGEAVFTGNYSGSTQTQHPLLTEERVREVLTQAMGYAVDEAVKDRRLVDKLNQLS